MSSRYKNSKRQNFFNELTQSLRVYLLFLNIIEKLFYCWGSRYKNSKRRNFLTNWLVLLCIVTSSLFFLNKYREVVLLLKFSIQKIQRGGIFYSNWHSRFEFICFFANIIEKWFLMSSRYKKFKEAEFFYSNWQVLLLRFSIQKIQRGRIFNELTWVLKQLKKAKKNIND
jgi:hypothetical protein